MFNKLSANLGTQNLHNTALHFVAIVSGFLLVASYFNEGYHAGFASINSVGYKLPSWLLQNLTILGDGIFLLPVFLVLGARNQKFIAQVFWVSVIGAIVVNVLKTSIDALRPPAILTENSFHLLGKAYQHRSFPSGHTFSAFSAATLLILHYQRRWLTISLLLLACLVGLSRIWLGVHWPLDTLAGASLGIVLTIIVWNFLLRFPLLCNKFVYRLSLTLMLAAAFIGLTQKSDYVLAQLSLNAISTLAIYIAAKPFIIQSFKKVQEHFSETPVFTSKQFPLYALILIAISICLYRLLILTQNHFELFYDEAYYYHWSLEPALGYYSKPPMVAWLIALGTKIFGQSIFGLRFFSPILYGCSAIIIYFATHTLTKNTTLAFLGSLLVLFSTISGFNSEFITTDAPLFFFWSCSLLFFLRALTKDSWTNWILAGLSVGFGMLSKFTMAALPLSFFCFLLLNSRHRHLLANPRPWVAAILAGILFSLNLFWNYENNWSAFKHTQEIAQQDDSRLHFFNFFEFLLAQVSVFGPIWIALFGVVLWRYWRNYAQLTNAQRDQGQLLLFCVAGILGLISIQALTARAFANWAAPWILSASIFTVVFASLFVGNIKKWIHTGLICHILVLMFFYHWPQILAISGVDANSKNDPFHRVKGWQALSAAVKQKIDNRQFILTSDSRDLIAYIGFYAFPGEKNFARWNPDASNVRDHYDLKYNLRNYLHVKDPFLFVSHDPLEASVLARFDKTQYLGKVIAETYTNEYRSVHVYIMRRFNGYEE